ncbi:MAG: hypothetical protein CW742_12820 [Methanoregula sp.]|nr:MAG: hypothetical protein CW742_12820 [Methanoregula sp.]
MGPGLLIPKYCNGHGIELNSCDRFPARGSFGSGFCEGPQGPGSLNAGNSPGRRVVHPIETAGTTFFLPRVV